MLINAGAYSDLKKKTVVNSCSLFHKIGCVCKKYSFPFRFVWITITLEHTVGTRDLFVRILYDFVVCWVKALVRIRPKLVGIKYHQKRNPIVRSTVRASHAFDYGKL